MATAPDKANKRPLYLGVDGGGSKCRAIILDADRRHLGTGLGGPANPLHGLEQALNSIVNATDAALTDAGLPRDSKNELIAGLGLAGVNLPSLFEQVKNWHHPFAQCFLTTDLHIACLGAHRGEEGAVIVSGTGSCGYAQVNGKSTIVGAHGFPFGDKGSGAWMGLEAIKAVLLASDELGPPTRLTQLMADDLGVEGVMIVDKFAGAGSSEYARLSALVLRAAEMGDAVALSIVNEGAAYLDAVAEKLWQTGVKRMSLIGGLGQVLKPWLAPATVAGLSEPLMQPEFGAVYFAQQEYASFYKPQATQQ